MSAREPQYLYLTTTGRRSGLPREIEIWFTRNANCYYVISEHGRKAKWVTNVEADPEVTFRVGEQQFSGSARILDPVLDGDLMHSVQHLSREKYGWGEGLVVELRPGT
jgi:deazaflavin-dependent oxidoreductase (nitroreductase family)